MRPLHTASFPAQEQQQWLGSLVPSSMPISQESGEHQRHLLIAVVLQSSSSIPMDTSKTHSCVLNPSETSTGEAPWSTGSIPRRLKPLHKAAFLPWVALGTLAHSSMPSHSAPERFGQRSFPSWVHQRDLEPSYTEALPSLPDKMAWGPCTAFSLTLQQQVSGSLIHSSDPISMKLVVIKDLGTGL